MRAFPKTFRTFCASAGVDLLYPSEVFHNARVASLRHSYGGWFHLAGSIVSGRLGWLATSPTSWSADFERLAPDFAVGLSSKRDLVPGAFGDAPVVQVDFDALLPWVLEVPEVE
jgi:hypothetical protein